MEMRTVEDLSTTRWQKWEAQFQVALSDQNPQVAAIDMRKTWQIATITLFDCGYPGSFPPQSGPSLP